MFLEKYAQNSNEEQKKAWQSSVRLFIVVENIGVEPMTSCMPCKRSSQLS